MESHIVTGWHLQGVDFATAPATLAELASRFISMPLQSSTLIRAGKWEPLFRGHVAHERNGWVTLSTLAKTRRGIATGANDFFLINASEAKARNIRPVMLLPCVGRAANVSGHVFSRSDYDALVQADAKCLLLNIVGAPTEAEVAYLALGERQGLRDRYLLANRQPWYSMEQRNPAPIWAAVFGRGDLGFVYNEAGVRSLTNFHCVYPDSEDPLMARALTAALNSTPVQEGARAHIRGYGGGLMKFEPNDLKSISVPNLAVARQQTVRRLSELLNQLDEHKRLPANSEIRCQIDELVITAGEEAAARPTKLL